MIRSSSRELDTRRKLRCPPVAQPIQAHGDDDAGQHQRREDKLLLPLISDGTPEIRAEAMSRLADMKNVAALTAMLERLGEDPEIVKKAVKKFGPDAEAPVLARLVDSTDSQRKVLLLGQRELELVCDKRGIKAHAVSVVDEITILRFQQIGDQLDQRRRGFPAGDFQ